MPPFSDSPSSEAPSGWWMAGSHPSDYEGGSDHMLAHSGQASGYIKASRSRPRGFGTLMQMIKADRYRGQRLRLSAFVKPDAVKKWAGVWMRVDGPAGKVLGFDNMQNRSIQGTADWGQHEIVLDVPEESVYLAFGILLSGPGQVWVDDFRVEAVGSEVPTTDQAQRVYSDQPSNLDFEG